VTGVEIVVVVIAVATGALVQATAGIGITLVAAPFLLAVDPAFLPLPMILAGTVVGVRNLVGEFRGFDARRWWLCLLGAPVGLIAGELSVASLSERGLRLSVGVLVLASVGALLSGWQPPRAGWTPVLTGCMVSFGVRVAALPGPPYAILHHDDPPHVFRPNLASFVLVMSIVVTVRLAVAGEITARDLGLSILVMASAVIGLALSPVARRLVDKSLFRPLVLTLCGLGGLATVIGAVG
jgi:hypothetical protein